MITIRRVFISFQESDRKYANKIRLWAKRGLCCPPNQRLLTLVEREKIRLHTEPKPKQNTLSIGMKILASDFIIVLLGNDNENHPWAARDGLASQKGVIRYFMRIPYSNGELPENLKDLQQLAYNPNALEYIFRTLPPKPPLDVKKKTPSNKKYTHSSNNRDKHFHHSGFENRNNADNPQTQHRPKHYKPYHSTKNNNQNEESPFIMPPPPTHADPPTVLKNKDFGLEW